ncbi:hypothetical protein MNBD_GAMMA25-607 [hydrothermal vent metagenome]|uniref:cAMP-binding proteins - catabolite gene activator and regulatory subunit of cAMP-dependent protein kinases n=1 Tax=hydrothermal vent metagenome TaxID=652676 RepID=A0A3B1B1N0_9ZZZZ
MTQNEKLQRQHLKCFEPLGELSDARLDELLSLVYTEKFSMGASLFREGDIENQTMYLLSGDVQLSSSDGRIDSIVRHADDLARHPLDDSQPRQSSGLCITPVKVLRIDNSILDYMMMWDQVGISVELENEEKIREQAGHNDENNIVDPVISEKNMDEEKTVIPVKQREKEDEVPDSHHIDKKAGSEQKDESHVVEAPVVVTDDRAWIRKMSHIMAFKSMPPANIKYLLEKMDAHEVKQGECVVKQGDAGEYYYVLVDGKAQVTRTVELATLMPGRSFGEEALLSGSQRNASVTMLEDGVVMRLDKRDFDDMLKEPMLNRIVPSEARAKIAEGAHWLDIRHAKEFNHSHLPDAINIPLHELRLRIEELDKEQSYICYCRTGHRSSAAAFLLVQNGFTATVLSGGVQVMARDLIVDS